jgi:hypothetical protein
MAHQTVDATEWLYSNRTKFDAKFAEFDLKNSWGLNLFDFEVSLIGGKHVGRGTSASETEAMAKAVSEAFERMVCAELCIATHGVAAHPKMDAARLNARLESFERAAFQYHLINEISFFEQSVLQNTIFLVSAIEQKGASVSFSEMIGIQHYKSSLCVIRKNDQVFLGLGVSEIQEDSQQKSAIEAFRNFAFYCKNSKDFFTQIETDKDLWSCDSNFFQKHHLVFNSQMQSGKRRQIDMTKNLVEILNTDFIPELPLFIARSQVTLGEVQ